jgi:site-specific DNA-cytosine methylase
MKIAVLFDGAGLSRLGLEMAGHDCTGYELDPMKHALSLHVGSGKSILSDATTVDLSGYDAVWASPPCQLRSVARTQGPPTSQFSVNYLEWCLKLPHNTLWVENVYSYTGDNTWGTLYNAAQFTPDPIQNRVRIIGGKYNSPKVQREFKRFFKGVCPAILASEWKGSACDVRRASRFYKRKLTLDECAYHQGFSIPAKWYEIPAGIKKGVWNKNLYEAIGNGVPVYMAKAFGEAAV